tara:strand:+ start:4026 stop:5276 length:1251 start_codon:yes stop_codon:yes gene_type:complete
MHTLITFFLILFFSLSIYSHGTAGSISEDEKDGRIISFPDTKRYKTLVTDLHTHSVFSDGHVWPNIRVKEALLDGLDVLAVTEHLEYQPHIADIPHPDRNKSYLEAKTAAGKSDILIINGSEITRDMPPGHINAVFVKDANKLINLDPNKEKEAQAELEKRLDEIRGRDRQVMDLYALASLWPPEEAVREANNQDAFVFWNHPMWGSQKSDGIAELTSMHKDLISKGLLHGVEVVNGDWYSEEAFQIAIDNNLAVIGTSDVHNLIDWDYKPHKGGHRPVTLVFANSKREDSVKEALKDRRTVVWFKNTLFGIKRNLQPLLEASLTIESAKYNGRTQILSINIKNESDVVFKLMNRSNYTFTNTEDLVEVPAQGYKYLEVKTKERLSLLELDFEVLNALEAPKVTSKITLKTRITSS